MKTHKVGVVAVAILMVVGGIGVGIAQAGGTHSEQPVLSFADIESLGRGNASSSYVETRPVLAFQDSAGPIETGAIPATGSEEPWMKDYGHD